MCHTRPARPLLALAAACLMTTAVANSQIPQQGTSQPQTIVAALTPPPGPPAIAGSDSPEALAKQLEGKTFYVRGFYQDEHLEFDTSGRPARAMQKGSFALSAVEIDQVKITKHSIEMKAHRLGLHFFGALPYEDDTKPFELIKVDPKKFIEIDIERRVIEPEKKKKKKDLEKEVAARAAASKSGAPALAKDAAPLPEAPEGAAETDAKVDTPAGPAPATAAAATAVAAAPTISPEHDPRISFLELSKAINVVFAPGLNDSVIATLPPYWQNYFASRAGRHSRAVKVDASALRPGGDVKPPQLLNAIDPASNEYAQKNNIAGLIFLQTVVGASGQPGDVTIVRPIGFGLDEKAVEAVQHSHFRPGTLNGTPVAEVINLQVTFRIYSDRTKPTGQPPPPLPTQVAPREAPKGPPSNAPAVASAGSASL